MSAHLGDVLACGVEERFKSLRVAYGLLQASWPRCQANGVTNIGPNSTHISVAFQLPGVLIVRHRYTGALIARSLPGQPLELDAECLQ